MSCKLIAFTPFPTGSFPFKETHNGVTYDFPDIGLDIQTQAREILKFRKANNFPRATFNECLDDLNIYTCDRLGCDKRFCSDGTTPQATFQQSEPRGCGTCGIKI